MYPAKLIYKNFNEITEVNPYFRVVYDQASSGEINARYHSSSHASKNIGFKCYRNTSWYIIRFWKRVGCEEKARTSTIFEKNGWTLLNCSFFRWWFNVIGDIDPKFRSQTTIYSWIFWPLMHGFLSWPLYKRSKIPEQRLKECDSDW